MKFTRFMKKAFILWAVWLLVVQQFWLGGLEAPAVAADIVDWYDLQVVKSVLDDSNAVAWWTITYRLTYQNSTWDAISGVSVVDSWPVELSNPVLVASSPDVASHSIIDAAARTFTVTWASLWQNQQWTIDLMFDVDAWVVAWDTVTNTATCDSTVEDCEWTTQSFWQSSRYAVPVNGLPQASVYDLEVVKAPGICSLAWGVLWSCTGTQATYVSGDTVYFTIWIMNNAIAWADPQVDNIAFVDKFDESLTFVGVHSESTPWLIWAVSQHPDKPYVWFSDWFTLLTWTSTSVVLEFTINEESWEEFLFNDAQVWTLRNDVMVGQPLEYISSSWWGGKWWKWGWWPSWPSHNPNNDTYTNFLYMEWEAATANNETQASISTPPFDLSITKTLVWWTVAYGQQLTYRLDFTNNGPARSNIGIKDTMDPNEMKLISLTTSSWLQIDSEPTLWIAPNSWRRWRGVTLWENESWWIEMVVEYPQEPFWNCTWDTLNTATIWIATETSIDPVPGNDTDTLNNIVSNDPGQLPVPSEGCVWAWYDLSLANSTTSTNVCPWDVVEFTYDLWHQWISDKKIKLDTIFSSNGLEFLESSVEANSAYVEIDPTTPILSWFFADHDTALSFDEDAAYLENDGYPQAYEDQCPNRWKPSSVWRQLEQWANQVFENRYYQVYNQAITQWTHPYESIVQWYIEWVVSTYEWLQNQTVDEAQASIDQEECIVERALESGFFWTSYEGVRAFLLANSPSWAISDFDFNKYSILYKEIWHWLDDRIESQSIATIHNKYIKRLTWWTAQNFYTGFTFWDSPAVLRDHMQSTLVRGYSQHDLINLDSVNSWVTTVMTCADANNGDFTDWCDNNFAPNSRIGGGTYTSFGEALQNPNLDYNTWTFGVAMLHQATPTGTPNYNPDPERDRTTPQFIELENGGYLFNSSFWSYNTEQYKVRFLVKDVPNWTVLSNTGRISMPCIWWWCLTDLNGGLYNTAGEEIPWANNESTASVTVNCPTRPTVDLRAEQSVWSPTATVGDSVLYTINYCNDAATPTGTDTGLAFTYPFSMLRLEQATGQLPSSTYIQEPWLITFSSVRTLAPAECGTFTLNFTAIGEGQTWWLADTSVLFGQDLWWVISAWIDPTPVNNSDTDQVKIASAPILLTNATGDKQLLTTITNTVGETITYRLTVDNMSWTDQVYVDITDLYEDDYLSFDTATIAPTTTTAWRVEWKAIPVSAWSTLDIDVSFTLDTQLPQWHVLVNRANYTVTYAPICTLINDTDTSNNTSTHTFTIPTLWVCGDGVVNPWETCDDGNAVDDDACSNACIATVCGDGVVNNGEACDDGNADDTDGCSNTCTVPVCGDGVVAWTETCDDGNSSDSDNCKNDCTANICGDGVVNTLTETCDDGNMDDTDGCYSAGSTAWTPCSFTSCGDTIVQAPNGYWDIEACDEGAASDSCQATCIPATCGDWIVQMTNGLWGTEQCDNWVANSDTGSDACRMDCTLPVCGDGVVDTWETCDDGNTNDTDACSNTCTENVCTISGIVYIDETENKIYREWEDEVIDWWYVTLTETWERAEIEDGSYEFTDLSCTQDYTVVFTKTLAEYNHTSSQYQYETQEPLSVTTIPRSSFSTWTLFVSPDNNFGLNKKQWRITSIQPQPPTEPKPLVPSPLPPVEPREPFLLPPEIMPEPPTIQPEILRYTKVIKDMPFKLPGRHMFEDTPVFLQSWIWLDEWKARYGISTLEQLGVQTTPPTWWRPELWEWAYSTDLDYWLDNVLLPYDAEATDRDIYVLMPTTWYIVPVDVLPEDAPVAQQMRRGEFVDVRNDMQEEFAQGWIHHTWSVLPWELWKQAIALHSSWFRENPGRYTEGKYPTIGQMLVTLEVWDPVHYYLRGDDGEYTMYTYTVTWAKNIDASAWEELYPQNWYEAVLYTCTDFGLSDNRFVVSLELDAESTPPTLIDRSGISDERKSMVDKFFERIFAQDNDTIVTTLNTIWTNLDRLELRTDIELMNMDLFEYVRFVIVRYVTDLEQ